jgi:hypothetical protein
MEEVMKKIILFVLLLCLPLYSDGIYNTVEHGIKFIKTIESAGYIVTHIECSFYVMPAQISIPIIKDKDYFITILSNNHDTLYVMVTDEKDNLINTNVEIYENTGITNIAIKLKKTQNINIKITNKHDYDYIMLIKSVYIKNK